MTRLQKFLSVLLFVQLVVAAIVLWPDKLDAVAAGPLLGEIDQTEVASLTIADDRDNSVTLSRNGSTWILSSGGDYPAQSSTVDTLVGKLLAVKDNRLVTRTSSSHSRLKVAEDDFARRIQVEMAGGSTQTIFLGTAPNARSIHVRLDGQDEVYLTGEMTSYEANATHTSWIDAVYVSIQREQITTMLIKNNNGEFTLNRAVDEEWTLEGLTEEESFDPARANQILGQIANLRMLEPLGKDSLSEYELDDPQAQLIVAVETDEGTSQSYTLQVGAHDEENNSYVVKWSNSPFFVNVS